MKIDIKTEENLEDIKDKKDIKEKAKGNLIFQPKNISVFKLIFHISSYIEIILMLIGCVGYIGAGLADPIMGLLLGDTINKFIRINRIISAQISQEQYNIAMKDFMDIARKMVYRFIYIGVICFFSNFIGGLSIGYSGLRQIHNLKKNYFKIILNQEQSWFDENNSFELSTKVQIQLEQIELGLGDKYGLVVLNLAKYFQD